MWRDGRTANWPLERKEEIKVEGLNKTKGQIFWRYLGEEIEIKTEGEANLNSSISRASSREIGCSQALRLWLLCTIVLVSNRWSEETTPASLSHQVSPIKRRKMVLTLHAPSPPKSPQTFLTFSPFRPTHPGLALSPPAFLLSVFPSSLSHPAPQASSPAPHRLQSILPSWAPRCPLVFQCWVITVQAGGGYVGTPALFVSDIQMSHRVLVCHQLSGVCVSVRVCVRVCALTSMRRLISYLEYHMGKALTSFGWEIRNGGWLIPGKKRN